jgi:hypothetical protein
MGDATLMNEAMKRMKKVMLLTLLASALVVTGYQRLDDSKK